MSVNKYKPHVWVIPEDEADRQLVRGFLQHHAVDFRAVGVNEPAGGWQRALEMFEEEFVPYLRNYPASQVVLVIDFDDKFEPRFTDCSQRIPEDLKARVFVIGSKDEPETLRTELKMSFETIGRTLAEDCGQDDLGRWSNPHLAHNLAELQRLIPNIKPILFPGA